MLKDLKKALLPPRMIVKITNINGDGTVAVQSDSGFGFNVIGSGAVDSYVYVQNGMLIGAATSLPHGTIDV